MSYTGIPAERWAACACRRFSSAYEAASGLLPINAQRFRPAFCFSQERWQHIGNGTEWIHDAMRRTLRMPVGRGLDVRLVSYRARRANSN